MTVENRRTGGWRGRFHLLRPARVRRTAPRDEVATEQEGADYGGSGTRIILDSGERLAGRTPEYRLVDEAELVLAMYAPGARRNADLHGMA